ncbi:MAG TPA: serine/threonine-protein kinase [Kofleriaceae bacterium]|jgi:serine/threonine-protein kinase
MDVGDDATVAATASGTVKTADVPATLRGLGALTPGQVVDHYMIGERIGAGGMGEVYRAVDQTLKRTVAIKIMRPSNERDRLLAEAQAMAKLSHPNVVVVHEAGLVDARVFIAMELVEGGTLRAWITPERTWREILGAFLAAGRGLVAVHEAGLVHRDFKPDNVLVGVDGRVRVADLGLAASMTEQVQVVGGTPRYMAPEQRAGEVDARSDQFAFAVALSEALAGREFPAWIRIALERAIEADPAARWPSLADLLQVLSHDPRIRRRRNAAIAGGGAVLAAAALILLALRGDSVATACDAAANRITSSWSPIDPFTMRARFIASGRSHAPTTADLVHGELDRYASDWREHRRDVCLASARKEQTEKTTELRVRCLDRLADQMRALTTIFERDVDVTIVDRAVSAVDQLTPPSECAGNAALADIPLPSPAQAPEVDALRVSHDAIVAAIRAGRFQQTLDSAHAQAKQARVLGYAPSLAEALAALATLETELHDDAAAEHDFTDAIAAAGQAHDDAVANAAWNGLVALAIHHQRFESAAERLTFARAVAARSGATPAVTAALDQSESELLYARGDYPAALAKIDRVLDRMANPGLSTEDRASALGQRARILTKLHRDVEAVTAMRGVVTTWQTELGPDHPKVAKALVSLGLGEINIKKFAEALPDLDRALALSEAIYGKDSIDVAAVLVPRCNALIGLTKYDAAKVDGERALAIRTHLEGSDSVELPPVLAVLAKVAEMRDDFKTNQALRERMLAIHIKAYGENHPDVVQDLMELGNLAKGRHDLTGSLVYFERAYAIAQTLDEQTQLADAIVNLANIHSALGHPAQARELVFKALALHEALDKAHHTPFTEFNVGIDHKMIASIAIDAHDDVTAEKELRISLQMIEPNVGVNKSDVVDTMGSLCLVLMDQNKFKDAIDVARRALAIAESEDDKGSFRATLNLIIAEASWEIGDHKGGIAAAKAAGEIYSKLPKTYDVTQNEAELAEWVKTHHE